MLAFWPSLPAIMGIALAQIALLLALPLLSTAPLRSLAWSPPIPPPRMSAPSR
ncbi:hypothetical protein K2Z83_02900 [Oscillochloris sp. ZM17-4]|uniref:hypothetical protein n=1 Tax=Oscillochloris sp. ZM17-4 TaxID=2866714 RepID=UPI001C73271E|nr:hypothetical protein [Oscillochloris sp. ZM17-4]MBX0326630.1 hypothetical protein [Oscillochloris sp. ZM17-4]